MRKRKITNSTKLTPSASRRDGLTSILQPIASGFGHAHNKSSPTKVGYNRRTRSTDDVMRQITVESE
jgi:hypothetical protein